MQHDILRKEWYENSKTNERDERLRIIEAVVGNIREDIRSVAVNNDYYPSTQMFDDINYDVPNTLTHFLEEVILKDKRKKSDQLHLKYSALSHAIIAAVRPRLLYLDGVLPQRST